MDKNGKTAHRNSRVLSIAALVAPTMILVAACGKKEPPIDTRLYGYWESVERGARNVGLGLEMFPGDSVVRVMGRMADRPYFIEGNLLTLDMRLPGDDTIPLDTSNCKTYTVDFALDTLIRSYKGATGWYVRVDDYMADSNSILGTWRMARTTEPTLEPSIERFSPDGILYARVFGRAQAGTYRVVADTLTLTYSVQETLRYTYRIAGDTLFISLEGGKEGAYLRAGPRNWYGGQSP